MNAEDRATVARARGDLQQAIETLRTASLGIAGDSIVRTLEAAHQGLVDLLLHDPDVPPAVHFLLFGLSVCSYPPAMPKDWPATQKWSDRWEEVTCEACKKRKAQLDEVLAWRKS